MIICMCKVICVTNRHLCRDDFLQRIEKIAESGAETVILREKDMTETEYETLAKKVIDICHDNNILCVLHSFTGVALKLGCSAIHLPLPLLRQLSNDERKKYKILGSSCHSLEEAVEAEGLGCTYIIAGHIFATDCKKGLKPKGTDFLKSVCATVKIPVYAIGGINKDNIISVMEAGVNGVCIMSGLMNCENPHEYVKTMQNEYISSRIHGREN